MEERKKITVVEVLSEGFVLGVKNIASMLGALILWLITIWIPYLNVGTTIAMSTIPIELSKGKVISPLFIFDGKYRQYMGEYFTLIGLMSLALVPAFFCMLLPGIVICIGWSLAIYILLDKGLSPGEAMVRSNKATQGYKWTIFGVYFTLGLIGFFVLLISALFIKDSFMSATNDYAYGALINHSLLYVLFLFILFTLLGVVSLGCNAVIYRNLTAEGKAKEVETVETPTAN